MVINQANEKLQRLAGRLLNRPEDIASLAAFRILFGCLMAFAMVRFLAKGWVTQLYVQPRFFFSYPGFGWVHPWPDFWMHAHFVCLAVLALGIAFGLFYRICAALFFLGFTYVELLDQTAYLNHYYLITLLSGLMVFLPAHHLWSLDTRRHPEIRTDTVPAVMVNLLRFQVGIVYAFAGLAKFNSDWLLHAEPMRIWLAARSDLPLIGPWFNETWVAYAASWFGALFDTTIVFFLLRPGTRWLAYLVVVGFHIATWVLFNIGIFPWLMMVSATLFFPPNWPRRALAKLGALFPSRHLAAAGCEPAAQSRGLRASTQAISPWMQVALAVYGAVQLALPLRSLFAIQPTAWTCSGFNCAWRVMIAEKTGYAEFYAFDPASGRSWKVPLEDYITPRQEILMAQDPYLIREMARGLAADLRKQGFPRVQIRVCAIATLNGHPSQPLINPQSDLAQATGPGWLEPLRY